MSTFSQLNFKNGEVKLQAGTSSLLCLTNYDGGNLLVQSSETSEYIPIRFTGYGLNQELFNHTACVEGTINQSLAANTLYSVYVRNLTGNDNGINPQADNPKNNRLEFWRTFAGFNPTIDNNGIFIANTGGPNTGLTYVGQVYTGPNNISTLIDPSFNNLRCPVYSHYNPWYFGFQTAVVTNNNFRIANNGIQANPSIFFVTEGLHDCPTIHGTLNFYALPGNLVTFEFYLNITGVAIDDNGGSTAWIGRSPSIYLTSNTSSTWNIIQSTWMSAPPIGHYTVKAVANILSGSAITRINLLGNIPY